MKTQWFCSPEPDQQKRRPSNEPWHRLQTDLGGPQGPVLGSCTLTPRQGTVGGDISECRHVDFWHVHCPGDLHPPTDRTHLSNPAALGHFTFRLGS
jgi:hypothetical protein